MIKDSLEHIEATEKRIEKLESLVDDLRWRMNAMCNFIDLHFNSLVDPITKLYMTEEVKND